MSRAIVPGLGIRLPRSSSSLYPEAREVKVDWLRQWISTGTMAVNQLFRPLIRRRMREFAGLVEARAAKFEHLDDHAVLQEARRLGRHLKLHGLQSQALADLFSLIGEVCYRQVKMRHFHTQVMGGWSILHGQVAEMATGEGKTLTIALPAATAALTGIPVHVITVNDYLTQRDADFLRPVYEALGLRVGVIVHGMEPDARRDAYDCHITYCTNKELAFDYLKDRLSLGNRPGDLRMRVQQLCQDASSTREFLLRGLHFGIVDEADSVLIDEARTPLIISGEQQGTLEETMVQSALAIAKQMQEGTHFRIDDALRQVEMNPEGESWVEQCFHHSAGTWGSLLLCEDLVQKALTALYIFKRDEDYLVTDGKVEIIDEYTGRAMSGRQWSKGLHQLVEAKEDCPLSEERATLSRISYQRFFRRYKHLAGMTGTARESSAELWSVYHLPTLPIPTYRESRRRFEFYRIFPNMEKKWAHVVDTVDTLYREKRPVLIGTRSVSTSEQLSEHLHKAGIPHRILNARHESDEAAIVEDAGLEGRVTIATNMAGRGTDIKLGQGVSERGGLFVLIVEHHEAKRIDRQLIGRCARQGDPGSYGFAVSLDDPLLEERRVGIPLKLLKRLVKVLPPAMDPMGKVIQGLAQRRIERMHYRMRKQVLRSDQDLERTLSFSGHSE